MMKNLFLRMVLIIIEEYGTILKELLKLLPLNNSVKISNLHPNLIIACYLHDIGMSVDPGIKHGIHEEPYA